MMIYYDVHPGGCFLARHDTIGFSEEEAGELAKTYQAGQTTPRLAVLQENMLSAIQMLDRMPPSGRA